MLERTKNTKIHIFELTVYTKIIQYCTAFSLCILFSGFTQMLFRFIEMAKEEDMLVMFR